METNQEAAEPDEEPDLHVETGGSPPQKERHPTKTGLCVETFALKECSVKLVSLESILFPIKRAAKTSGLTTPDTHSNTAPVGSAPPAAGTNKDSTIPTASVVGPQPAKTDQDGAVPVASDTKPQTLSDDMSPPEATTSPPSADQQKSVPLTGKQLSDKPVKTTKKYGCRMCKI